MRAYYSKGGLREWVAQENWVDIGANEEARWKVPEPCGRSGGERLKEENIQNACLLAKATRDEQSRNVRVLSNERQAAGNPGGKPTRR